MRKWTIALLTFVLLTSVCLAGSFFVGGGSSGAISSLFTLSGNLKVTVAIGQSRAANTSEGFGVCYSTTTAPYNPLRSFMMNNPRMNGLFFHGDFQTSTATDLIAVQDCLFTTGNNAQSGQSLGALLWYLQQDDDTYSNASVARAFVATGESGQTIAILSKPVASTPVQIATISGAADNGAGMVRLTISSDIADGSTVAVSGVAGTAEANGTWTALRIDATHIDLAESAFANAYAASSGKIYSGAGPFLGTNGAVTVTGAADNGAGLCRLTVDSLSSLTTTIALNSIIAVSGITGSTECNGGAWKVAAVGVSTIDLAGSAFANVYVSGGTAGGFSLWTRMTNSVSRITALALANYGKTTEVETAVFLQGEANSTTPYAAYNTAVVQFFSDLRTDLSAITGQSSAFDIIINPYNLASISAPTTVQYDLCAANADAHTWCNGPEYQLPYFSALHQSSAGVVQNAEQFGYAKSRILRGLGNGTLYVSNISQVGAAVTLTLIVPTGCVVLDTTTFPDATGSSAGNVKGFVWSDDSGKSVSSVAITGCSQITITLNGTPTTTKVLTYGMLGPGTVVPAPPAWGNFRDERGDTSRFVPGLTLRNWLMSFSKIVSFNTLVNKLEKSA